MSRPPRGPRAGATGNKKKGNFGRPDSTPRDAALQQASHHCGSNDPGPPGEPDLLDAWSDELDRAIFDAWRAAVEAGARDSQPEPKESTMESKGDRLCAVEEGFASLFDGLCLALGDAEDAVFDEALAQMERAIRDFEAILDDVREAVPAG